MTPDAVELLISNIGSDLTELTVNCKTKFNFF